MMTKLFLSMKNEQDVTSKQKSKQTREDETIHNNIRIEDLVQKVNPFQIKKNKQTIQP
jgi:hypothetical protein